MTKAPERPAEETKRWTVPAGAEPARLDVWLTGRESLPSRAFVQKLIREGRVTVDGKAARPSRRVEPGERIEATIPPPEPSALVPETIPLDVRYEDGDIVVVNKPPGMVVHPGAGVRAGTLVHALLGRYGALADAGAPERPGIVHRLDKETSGLLVAARNREAHGRLATALGRREVSRRYLAVLWGGLPDAGSIDAPVGRSARDRKKMTVTATGKDARSRYIIMERFTFAVLAEVALETGRTHQIRVHFAHWGHPVFGDPTYGGRRSALRGIAPERRRAGQAALGLIARQALHAWRLEFRHPATGERLAFEADPPEDMARLIEFLRDDLRAGDEAGGAGRDPR